MGGILGWAGRATYHLVDRLHDLEHLVVADLSVSVNVVELESPVQLVFHLASAGDAEGDDKLLEVDGPRLVAVEYVEYVIGKRRGVTEGEELPVDLLEFLLCERTRGAIFQETWRADPC